MERSGIPVSSFHQENDTQTDRKSLGETRVSPLETTIQFSASVGTTQSHSAGGLARKRVEPIGFRRKRNGSTLASRERQRNGRQATIEILYEGPPTCVTLQCDPTTFVRLANRFLGMMAIHSPRQWDRSRPTRLAFTTCTVTSGRLATTGTPRWTSCSSP